MKPFKKSILSWILQHFSLFNSDAFFLVLSSTTASFTLMGNVIGLGAFIAGFSEVEHCLRAEQPLGWVILLPAARLSQPCGTPFENDVMSRKKTDLTLGEYSCGLEFLRDTFNARLVRQIAGALSNQCSLGERKREKRRKEGTVPSKWSERERGIREERGDSGEERPFKSTGGNVLLTHAHEILCYARNFNLLA